MNKEQVSLAFFKDYAAFLLENHLDELVTQDLKRAYELDVPLLKFFSSLSEAQLFEVSKKGIREYLESIISGNALDITIQRNEEWKADKLVGISRDKVVASDIALIYNVRKHSLRHFLPKYTTDIVTITQILDEIEDYYTFQEELAIQTFAEITQDEIRKREVKLKEAQELAKLGYWEYDLATGDVFWSDELYAIYGLEKSEQIAADIIKERINTEDVPVLMEKVRAIYTQGGTFTHEYRIRHTDGDIRYLIDKAYTEKDVAGKLLVKGISQDITERKVAEIAQAKTQEQLREKHELLNEAQAIAHLGSWEWDVTNNMVVWSDELCRLFGFEPGELQLDYHSYLTYLHPEDKDAVVAAITTCIEKGSPYEFQNRIIRKDGEIRWHHSRGQVSEREGDKIIKLAGIAMDITHQKKINDALQLQTEALLASNKELEAFCYTISHDLRSPLRAIDGFGRKLANQYNNNLDTEGQRLLNVVRTNAQQMGVLIDSLLEFSRLNRKEIKKSVVDMEELVAKVIESIGQQNPDHKAQISFDGLLKATGDSELLKQVWTNLISNAIKFSAKVATPKIEITSFKKGEQVIYSIKDNGAGFEMEYKDKLFGVFQRLHSQDEFTGTGVGLATIQRIIHRHGGKVWAEGAPNRGASFYFTLYAPQQEQVPVLNNR